jgi:dGTPase
LEPLPIWEEITAATSWQNGRPLSNICRHEIIRELIGRSVGSVLAHTAANLDAHALNSPEKIQTHTQNIVGYTPGFGEKVQQLKQFLYQRMYRHYRLVRMQFKAERFISELFDVYLNDPKMLPDTVQANLDNTPLPRAITDYIAGMTDRYALDEWKKLFDPYSRT